MDLKEMVLSVLADMQAQEAVKKASEPQPEPEPAPEPPVPLAPEPLPVCEVPQIVTEPVIVAAKPEAEIKQPAVRSNDEELQFLSDLRERLLVIFEGFQSPNNKAIEAKVDLTLNFLEYLLSVTEERLEALKRA